MVLSSILTTFHTFTFWVASLHCIIQVVECSNKSVILAPSIRYTKTGKLIGQSLDDVEADLHESTVISSYCPQVDRITCWEDMVNQIFKHGGRQVYNKHRSLAIKTETQRKLWLVLACGLVSFISDAYSGSTSNRQIVEWSGLTQLMEPSDSVMADKGFDVQDIFAQYDFTVNMPTFSKVKLYFQQNTD